jgi:hypothetical protein
MRKVNFTSNERELLEFIGSAEMQLTDYTADFQTVEKRSIL